MDERNDKTKKRKKRNVDPPPPRASTPPPTLKPVTKPQTRNKGILRLY